MITSQNQVWSAAWIAHPEAGPKEYGVYHFRLLLSLEDPPAALRLRLSADSRYQFSVNGRLASEGPAPGRLRCWFYDTTDPAPFLVRGKNVLTATVWHFGEDRPWAQLGYQAAFILEAEDRAWHETLNSGKALWSVCEDPAYRPCWRAIHSSNDFKPIGARGFVDASQHPVGLFSGAARVKGMKRPVKIARPAVDACLRTCWDEDRRLVADTTRKRAFSQHANINAILAGAFETSQAAEVVDRILDDSGELITASLYYRFFLHRALKQAGRRDRFFEIIRPWHDKLDEGLTTFPETLLPGSRSDCHGWSAGLLYDFVDILAGLEIKEPGFANYAFDPCLGPMQCLECGIPAPGGQISFRAERGEDEVKVRHHWEPKAA